MIETLSIAELSRIQRLANLIWPSTFASILSEEQISFMLTWMYDVKKLEQQWKEGHQFSIYQSLGKDIGFIGVETNYLSNTETKLHKIYVLPEAQGTGVGRILLKHAERLAHESGATFLVLNVNRYNRKAVDFYLKQGFEIVKEEDIEIGNGYLMEDFVMKKRLSLNE